MTTKHLLASLSLLMLLTSCSKPSEISFQKRAEAAAKLDPKIIKAQNSFGLKLHQQLAAEEQNQNLFISPTSISLALVMAYNGSAGETAKAMAKALGWDGMTPEQINQGNQTMKSLLKQSGKGVQLDIANSLWTRKGQPFHKQFLNMNRQFYDAEVSELDFSSNKAIETINSWVKKNTSGKIPSILDRPFDPEDILAIVNAIYIKGSWKDEFSPNSTHEADFKLAEGSTKKVTMMNRTGTYEYLQEPGYQAIRLPYGEGQMDMLIILPSESSSLSALHESIWSDASRWQKPFNHSTGEIQLPRFKLEYGKSLDLALQKLGLGIAYDPKKADFSAMAPVPPVIYIGEVKHKTFLEVNEQGTEAAAATSITMKAGSAVAPTDRFQMIVNRPFFIAIEDRQTGAWLFTGSIYSP